MPFYAPDGGADGGQAGGTGDNGGETDYKALYEKLQSEHEKSLADNKKLKASFDQTAHEVAELKKAQKAKMSEEEQREAENAEKEQRYQEAMARVAEMETATLFAENGFDKKDYDGVAKKIVEVGGDKAKELAETLIAFVKKANESVLSNSKNGKIVDGAVTPQTSTAQASDTPFAEQAFAYTKHDDRSAEIKNKYRK